MRRRSGRRGRGAAVEVGEGVEGLQERVDELKAERDRLEAAHEDLVEERDALDEENERLQEQVADLEANVQELRAAFESTAEHVEQLASTFDVDVEVATATVGASEGDVVEAHRERVDELEAERDRLRHRLAQQGRGVEPIDGYAGFLEDDDVQPVIQEAKDQDYPSPKYAKGIIATILDERGPVSYEEVADRIGASRTNEVSSAATTLESFGVVEKEQSADGVMVDLNVDGLNEIREKAAARRRTGELVNAI